MPIMCSVFCTVCHSIIFILWNVVKLHITKDIRNINTFLRLLVRASSWYLNKGRPTWWHLIYYVNLLLNTFQMLTHPSSWPCDYLVRCCVGWLEACWCYVTGLSVGDVAGPDCSRIPHHQQPIPLRNTNTPQVSLHNNATSSRNLLKIDVLTSATCWLVNWHNKASVIKLVYLYSNINTFFS